MTQAYLVNGRSYQFHCPCKTCEWTFDGNVHPQNTVTDTFQIETVTPEDSGMCLYCRNVDTNNYTVFNLTVRDNGKWIMCEIFSVCTCDCVCVCACMCAYMRVCVCGGGGMCVQPINPSQPSLLSQFIPQG